MNSQQAPAAGVCAQAKLHFLLRLDLRFAERDVARRNEQVVIGSGLLLIAANGHLADQAAPLEIADLRAAQVERPIKLQNRLGRFEHHRFADPLLVLPRPFARKDHHRKRCEANRLRVQMFVVLNQQNPLIAFQQLRIMHHPRVGGKEVPK